MRVPRRRSRGLREVLVLEIAPGAQRRSARCEPGAGGNHVRIEVCRASDSELGRESVELAPVLALGRQHVAAQRLVECWDRELRMHPRLHDLDLVRTQLAVPHHDLAHKHLGALGRIAATHPRGDPPCNTHLLRRECRSQQVRVGILVAVDIERAPGLVPCEHNNVCLDDTHGLLRDRCLARSRHLDIRRRRTRVVRKLVGCCRAALDIQRGVAAIRCKDRKPRVVVGVRPRVRPKRQDALVRRARSPVKTEHKQNRALVRAREHIRDIGLAEGVAGRPRAWELDVGRQNQICRHIGCGLCRRAARERCRDLECWDQISPRGDRIAVGERCRVAIWESRRKVDCATPRHTGHIGLIVQREAPRAKGRCDCAAVGLQQRQIEILEAQGLVHLGSGIREGARIEAESAHFDLVCHQCTRDLCRSIAHCNSQCPIVRDQIACAHDRVTVLGVVDPKFR
eukprot:comp22529_c0_seq7/m.56748 comp22529_c0_seq7/g.56748  ORF comp22529_c0_seq7/g.56748 comp22529_c0_seq7/m.56748 type:complete len:455 (+) comp22529_c0_seq7:726-2090(+)